MTLRNIGPYLPHPALCLIFQSQKTDRHKSEIGEEKVKMIFKWEILHQAIFYFEVLQPNRLNNAEVY
jgi:hypothetical protein